MRAPAGLGGTLPARLGYWPLLSTLGPPSRPLSPTGRGGGLHRQVRVVGQWGWHEKTGRPLFFAAPNPRWIGHDTELKYTQTVSASTPAPPPPLPDMLHIRRMDRPRPRP